MYKYLKRALDIVGALVLLSLFWPFFIFLAAIIKLDSPGPVLYKQKRYNGVNKHFVMYKFRTMKEGAREEMLGKGIKPKKLITRTGKFLRETHIDELPQLINILKGDMSFIGVRPQQESEQKWMLKNEKNWAQRFDGSVGAVSIERLINIYPNNYDGMVSKLKDAEYLKKKRKRVEYDLYYVKNEGMYCDAVILWYYFKTIFNKMASVVFKNEYREFDNCDKKRKGRRLY